LGDLGGVLKVGGMSINTGISISISIGVGVVAAPCWPGFIWFLFYFIHFCQHRRHCSSPLARLCLVFTIIIISFFSALASLAKPVVVFIIFSASASLARLIFVFIIIFNFFGFSITGQAHFLSYFFSIFSASASLAKPVSVFIILSIFSALALEAAIKTAWLQPWWAAFSFI